MSPSQLLSDWQATSTLLRVVAGVKGLATDSLCRVRAVSSRRLLLVWSEGDCDVFLEDAILECHESAELSSEHRLDEEDEWSRQLVISWPGEPEKLLILYEQREPS